MPFTFSHPAVVLPLKRVFGKWLSLTGLIVGSLMPDFEYFIRMKIQSEYSHTFLGTLWFNLPLGIICCLIFHQIIKQPFIDNSPAIVQRRFAELKNSNWIAYFRKKWLIVGISIIIGAYSHILWDSFTHHNAYFVNLLQLDHTIGSLNIPIFKVLQHGSTLFGGVYLLYYVWNLEAQAVKVVKPKLNYWIGIVLITVGILMYKLMTGLSFSAYGNVIVSGIMAAMIATIVMSLMEKNLLKSLN
ncbi:MAG: DUF4184 family protein [Chitinophagales bacterium]